MDEYFLFPIASTTSQACDKLVELRNEKRRRMKYVTRNGKKSFYDVNFSLLLA